MARCEKKGMRTLACVTGAPAPAPAPIATTTKTDEKNKIKKKRTKNKALAFLALNAAAYEIYTLVDAVSFEYVCVCAVRVCNGWAWCGGPHEPYKCSHASGV